MILETAILAARTGGEELRARFSQPRTIAYKGAIDLVTDADTAAEMRIIEVIRSRHPNDGILAEESGKSGADGWIIDPLDGTTNYAHGLPQFCVSIAYKDEVGVIYDPLRDELFSAERGKGAFLNGQPLKTTAVGLEKAVLGTGFPYSIQQDASHVLALFSAFVTRAQGMRRFGSAALDLAWVAAGRLDGFFELDLKAWDVAAGAVIIGEAGGLVSAPDGSPLRLDKGDIVAAGRPLHAEMVATALAASR